MFFKKPGDNTLSYIESNDVYDYSIDDLTSEKCFLFAPYDTLNRPIKVFSYDEKLNNEAILAYADRLPVLELQKSEVRTNPNEDSSQIDFMNLVELIKSKIEIGECQKIIASRVCNELFRGEVLEGFLQLCDRYNHSFNYLIYISKECYWIGASPEVLLSCFRNELNTMSLAGTQLVEPGSVYYEWKDKEKFEQQIVTDYIVAVLESLKLAQLIVSKTHTFQAANLVHLKTDITATISDVNTLIKVLKQLHPTPAVCGLPKEAAQAFIDLEEMHDRNYYTGFIGEWEGVENTHLFVNLRCAELGLDFINYYVGCGITEGSQAEKEWEETEKKIETLKSVFV